MPTRGPAWPKEVRERAVLMMLEHQHEHGSQLETICSVAEKLGQTPETVRKWVRRAEVDGGLRRARTHGGRHLSARRRVGPGPGGAVHRPPARPGSWSPLGEVVESGTDLEPAAGRLPR